MKHLFIPYETGIPTLAKEYGFDKDCMACYHEQQDGNFDLVYPLHTTDWNHKDIRHLIGAPLYQQIVDWFILKGIEINTTSWKKEGAIVWYFSVNTLGNPCCYKSKDFNTKTEALNEAIKEAFKLI